MAGQRCARAGCRNWAMRGGTTCRQHRTAPAGEEAAAGDAALEVALESLAPYIERLGLSGQEESLARELGALRGLLDKLTREASTSRELAVAIPRVVNATVRALKARRAISGEAAGDLTEAITRVLLDMGLGE